MISVSPLPVSILVEERLDSLINSEPGLSELARYYQRRERLYQCLKPTIPTFTLDPDTIHQNLENGECIFQRQDFPFEGLELRKLWMRLAASIHRPELARIAFGEPQQFQDILSFLWEAEPSTSMELFENCDDQIRLLARDTIRPFLNEWRRQIEAQVDPDLDAWLQPICPFCGSQPTFAELQGSQAARHLRCGLCGGDWLYPRLICGLCGEEDYKGVGILRYEEEGGRYSIQTCDTCGQYLKTIQTFEPIPPDMLVCEDLATLFLDGIANQQGYYRKID